MAITLTLSGLRQITPENPENQNINSGDAPLALKSNATAGFVETHGVGICRGQYAKALTKEWHRWDKQNGSENDPVDIFEGDQLFVVRYLEAICILNILLSFETKGKDRLILMEIFASNACCRYLW